MSCLGRVGVAGQLDRTNQRPVWVRRDLIGTCANRCPVTVVSVPSRLTGRTVEGRTKKEIIRCLKRYVAREVFIALRTDLAEMTT